MLYTSWREVAGALFGAIVGAAIPLGLHILAAQGGDAEAWGVPLAAFSLPGLFLGAIGGSSVARKAS